MSAEKKEAALRARPALRRRFSPHLMSAAAVMRMGGRSLAEFLRAHQNPCLTVGGLPPPPPPADGDEDIRVLLLRRCREESLPPPLRALSEALVQCVGDDGLLEVPADWAAMLPAAMLDEAIARLQALAPAGACARDMRESLLLQLAAFPAGEGRDAAEKLVREKFAALARKRWDKLPKRLLTAAAPLLQKLSAPPISAGAAAVPAVPDVVFVRRRGLWKAEAAAGAAVTVAARAAAGATAAQHAEAKRIAAAARARRRWLLRAAQFAADRQSAFFSDGAAALRPLSLRQAAGELGVSAGFVSHIIADKHAVAPAAAFPLKYLFARNSVTGSGVAAQEMIKSIVEEENPARPLGDAALCARLRAQGVVMARRTVGKHRAAAGIAAASLRKRYPSAPPAKEPSHAN